MWKNDWQYEPYGKKFEVADGDHRVAILSAKDVMSKTGKNMIEITYKVEDSNGLPFIDRIVEGEYFNSNMSRIFDVFKITRGDWNYNNWRNKIALAHFEHKVETYTDNNGNTKTVSKANLVYFHNNVPDAASAPVQQSAPAQQDDGFPEDIPF